MILIIFEFGKTSFLLCIWTIGKCTYNKCKLRPCPHIQRSQTVWIFQAKIQGQLCTYIGVLYIFGKLFKNAFQWYNFRLSLMGIYIAIRFCLKKVFNTWSADYKVLSFVRRETPISLSSYIKRNLYHCLAFLTSFPKIYNVPI